MSLQNILFERKGFSTKWVCIRPWSLLHAPASPFVFFLFRAASQNRQSFGNTDTDDDNDDNDVHLCSMICKCVYTLRFPAFGLKSLQDGCALRMCCFCIVIQYCSIKIIKY